MNGERLFRAAPAAIALMVVLLGAPSASADPNDGPTGASGPILSGRMYEDTIGTENDVDWWVFYTGSSTEADMALMGGFRDECFGPEMALVDADGETIADTYYADSYETEHILRTVGPGVFYLKVEPYFLSCGFGPEARYTIWINSSPLLLSAPPYVPPPPPPPPPATRPSTPPRSSAPSYRCRRAEQRVAGLRRQLRNARTRGQRNRLRAALRRARTSAREACA